MNKEDFQRGLLTELNNNINALQSENTKDWIVKGFIDIYKNIYTISVDTKVVSKILELMLFPVIYRFAKSNNLKMIFSKHQNHYPDISFKCPEGNMFALDLKSTYRVSEDRVNGFTLGCFTGYFRNRDSSKNITFPYNKYEAHFVLGVIYSKQNSKIDERQIYKIEDIENILSVISDFEFVLHEKHLLAASRPGSGNTKNIGSIVNINKIRSGQGPFASLGVDIFDDYWMYYLTKDMAIDGKVPYSNLVEYAEYKKKGNNIDIASIEYEEESNIEE